MASLACGYGEGRGPIPSPGDFVILSDGEEPSTVHRKAGLALHIRALLPISGLIRKGHEAASAGELSGATRFPIINSYCSSMTSAQ
jgi:hypothetical protein